MKIYIKNLYGINNDSKSYYRKQGDFCFDFVNDSKYASDLTPNEAEKILQHAEYYKKQYRASDIGLE